MHISSSLKKTFTSYKFDYPNSTPKEHRNILKEYFSESVTIKDKQNHSCKCIAQLNNQSNEARNEFIKHYLERFYLKYPDKNSSNHLDISVENIKVTQPDYIEAIYSSYLIDRKNNYPYRAILKFILDGLPSEWNITSLSDLAIAIDPELTKVVAEYERLGAIEDIKIRSAIVRATVKLAMKFFEVC